MVRQRGASRGLDRRLGDVHRIEQCEHQLIEPDASFAAATGADRDLESSDLTDLSTAYRPPRKLDVPLATGDLRPVARKLVVSLIAPPDIVAGAVDELELEIVRRALTPQVEGEDVVRREIHVQGAMNQRIAAAAVEIEVDTHRPAADAAVRPKTHGDPICW